MGLNFGFAEHAYGSIFYLLAAFQGFMLLTGLVMSSTVQYRQGLNRDPSGLEGVRVVAGNATIAWYVMVAVWLGVYFTLSVSGALLMRARDAKIPPRWVLWLCFLGTPALWLAHFLFVYAFSEAAWQARSDTALSVNGVLLVATLLFAAASLALSVLAFRTRRKVTMPPVAFDNFLPNVGLVTGLLFTFVILVELLPTSFWRAAAQASDDFHNGLQSGKEAVMSA